MSLGRLYVFFGLSMTMFFLAAGFFETFLLLQYGLITPWQLLFLVEAFGGGLVVSYFCVLIQTELNKCELRQLAFSQLKKRKQRCKQGVA